MCGGGGDGGDCDGGGGSSSGGGERWRTHGVGGGRVAIGGEGDGGGGGGLDASGGGFEAFIATAMMALSSPSSSGTTIATMVAPTMSRMPAATARIASLGRTPSTLGGVTSSSSSSISSVALRSRASSIDAGRGHHDDRGISVIGACTSRTPRRIVLVVDVSVGGDARRPKARRTNTQVDAPPPNHPSGPIPRDTSP